MTDSINKTRMKKNKTNRIRRSYNNRTELVAMIIELYLYGYSCSDLSYLMKVDRSFTARIVKEKGLSRTTPEHRGLVERTKKLTKNGKFEFCRKAIHTVTELDTNDKKFTDNNGNQFIVKLCKKCHDNKDADEEIKDLVKIVKNSPIFKNNSETFLVHGIAKLLSRKW